MPLQFTRYRDVPWYRRSGTMTLFILFGFFLIPPLLWAACFICLTGSIYYPRTKKDGTLAQWSPGNKVGAVIILVVHSGLLYWNWQKITARTNSTPPAKAAPAKKAPPAFEWESWPEGFTIKPAIDPKRSPEGPLAGPWPYKWSYRLEVHANDRPLRVTSFQILAWNGTGWLLDEKQAQFNSGRGDAAMFAEWFDCPEGRIEPGKPAVDKECWAGSKARLPLRQRWVVLGEDSGGAKFRGDRIVDFPIR